MTSSPDDLKLFEIYLATAEKVSDRRAAANASLLAVNGAVVALFGYLAEASEPGDPPGAWRWAVPVAGGLICLAWFTMLTAYRKLNAAKFEVLHEMERRLDFQPFAAEESRYRRSQMPPLTRVESWTPFAFMLLYVALAFTE